jgi:serine/threonine protein kinase
MSYTNSNIDKILGNHRIIDEIGSGSFGVVYLGEHLYLSHRKVAIKIMHSAHFDSWQDRESFLSEAHLLELLRHPHILPLLDIGIHEGAPYLVTEYMPKGSLHERLAQSHPHLLPPSESLRILSQIGQALAKAHQQNIIHRDLKPANILFSASEDALLADFGIATSLTTASVKQMDASGSPVYMSPEQFQGIVSKESDQYALACIAYELFTGHCPFTAPDPISLGFKHLTETPPPLTFYNPEIPTYVEQAVLKALAKQRPDRFKSIEAFIFSLLGSPHYRVNSTQRNHPQIRISLEDEPTQSTRALEPTSISVLPASSPRITTTLNPTSNYPLIEQTQSAVASYDIVTPLPLPVSIDFSPTSLTSSKMTPMVVSVDRQKNLLAKITQPANSLKKRKPLVTATILFLILVLLISGSFAAYYTFAYPGKAQVLITPQSKELSNTFSLTQTTDKSNTSPNTISGARLLTSTATKKVTVAATGTASYAASQATGYVTFVNYSSQYAWTFTAGKSFISNSGISIIIAQSLTLGGANSGDSTQTVPAYAANTGSSGNIPAYDLNTSCCPDTLGGTNMVAIYNATSFSGGHDAGTNTVVQQSDIDGASQPLLTPTQQSALSSIQAQVQTNERLVSKPQCRTEIVHNANVGDTVQSFDVTVTATCSAEVYNTLTASTTAITLLKAQAQNDLDPSFQLANIVASVTNVSVLNAKTGILSLTVLAEGFWDYHFSDNQKQALIKLIEGKSSQDAQMILSGQNGILSATVNISGGFFIWNNVPQNPEQIVLHINDVSKPGIMLSPTTPPTP